jgi:hypothetical protein
VDSISLGKKPWKEAVVKTGACDISAGEVDWVDHMTTII